ncbi:hypothetical protein C8J57DRAFT_1512040 [Mycena rebaudengoi]|nr:hypothetical protein C8J57DRAFT_1512040 [Mycena rebaudengoi]
MSKVILLTDGIKKGELTPGYRKVPSKVDLELRTLHGCVVTDMDVNPEWTHAECIKSFEKQFPAAFEYAFKQAKSTTQELWSIVVKEKQQLRVFPRSKPTGADLVEFKSDAKTGPASFFVVPISVYKTWYDGPTTVAPSSDKEQNERNFIAEEGSGDDYLIWETCLYCLEFDG